SFNYLQREARALFDITESSHHNFIKLVNSLEMCKHIDYSVRGPGMDSILTAKRTANDLSEELRKFLRSMTRDPESIGDAQIDAIGTLVTSLEAATDAIPRLQMKSAQENSEDSMQELMIRDRENQSSVNSREFALAIEEGD
ncbi:hypothetical protein PENTCL1PPCAC_22306, partial [Pristionchus entomophagus]